MVQKFLLVGILSVHQEVLPSSFLLLDGDRWGKEVEILVCVPQPWSSAVRAEILASKAGGYHMFPGGISGGVCTCHNHRYETLSQSPSDPWGHCEELQTCLNFRSCHHAQAQPWRDVKQAWPMHGIQSSSWAASEMYPRGRSSRKALGSISVYIIQAADQQMVDTLLPNCVFNSQILPYYQKT